MEKPQYFKPRIIGCLKQYQGSTFVDDLVGGLTVGVVALPLAMAFAIASGVPPVAGIISAVIGGFIISAFGGTRVSIGGPTGAFIIILAGIGSKYGMANLAICTIMAGGLLLLMGFARLGGVIKYIPYPVTMGFTSGIALLIFSTQIKDFLGLQVENVPSEFLEKMAHLFSHIDTLDWTTLILATVCFLCIRLWPRKWQRMIPASVVVLVVATALTAFLNLPVETIGSRFGGIPQELPSLQIPEIHFATLRELFQPALTIALLAAIESLLCAVVADGMVGDRHDSNQELIAQGLANLVTPLFGGIAVTGAIARTATNVRSGGRTPVAGIIHAITLLVILLAAAPLAKFIPLAALSALLVNVAFHMGEWHNFKRLLKWPRSDAMVFLITFLLTVLIDLTVAIEVGMVFAAILFIKGVTETSEVSLVSESTEEEGSQHSIIGRDIPQGVAVYQMFGTFLFGAADKLESILRRLKQEPDVLILRMRHVTTMDATGLNVLEALYEQLHGNGKHMVLSGVREQPMKVMRKGGFIDRIGEDNFSKDIIAALERSKYILSEVKKTENTDK